MGGAGGGAVAGRGRAVAGRGDSRGRGFPRTGILPNIFDGMERAGEARRRCVMGGRSEFPTIATSGTP